MLYVFTRDGKAYNDFLEIHNLTKDNTRLIRSIDQISKIDTANYVLLLPYPTGFDRRIKSHLNHWKNLTSYYNSKELQG